MREINSAKRASARLRRLAAALPLALLGLAAANVAAAETVRVGTANTSSDAAFYIGIKKGFFKQQGIDVQLVQFSSASQMIAPLGAGQLDVGGGSSSAGLYNAASRGVGIKIVADKGSIPPGHGFQALLVRKDLVTSGRYKGLKDLKGFRFASNGNANGSKVTIATFLEKGGLKYSDVKVLSLNTSQHIAAFANKAVDASITTEPTVTEIVKQNLAVRIGGDDMVYPNHQLAAVLYGDHFIKEHREAAKKFMVAYIQAARFYTDALKGGKLAGPNAREVIQILSEYTKIKDPAIYSSMVMQATNPDGHVNMASLQKDYSFFKEQHYLTGNATVQTLVDNSFADEADRILGPYHPK